MADNRSDLKGLTLHAGLRALIGIALVVLFTYGAHRAFEVYQKYLMKETAANIDSSKRKEIDGRFSDSVLKKTVKPGYLGPNDGIERYLGEEKKTVVKKVLHKKIKFTENLLTPIDYELNETFFGWRTNDLINRYLTIIAPDNKENYQLGILNAVRIYTKVLLEKLSKESSASPSDKDIKDAYNAFMVDETRYIGPSAEFKYRKAINSINSYSKKVRNGDAGFFVSPENLIFVLNSTVYLLNDCENILKTGVKEGKELSTFEADNCFYYSKGVAKVVSAIIKGIKADFAEVVIISGKAGELLKAAEKLDIALSMEPFIVTEGGLDGIFANHRSNLANQLRYAKESLNLLKDAVSKRIVLPEKEKKPVMKNNPELNKKTGLIKEGIKEKI